MELIHVENLSVRFPEQTEPVLKDLNFTVQKGAIFCITGETGSG